MNPGYAFVSGSTRLMSPVGLSGYRRAPKGDYSKENVELGFIAAKVNLFLHVSCNLGTHTGAESLQRCHDRKFGNYQSQVHVHHASSARQNAATGRWAQRVQALQPKVTGDFCYHIPVIRGDIAVNRTYKHVGRCIYCDATKNLHDEHCIPESLNGVRILEKGSCGDCAKITSKFEGDYARISMLPARTALKMKSKRSKSKRPTEFPIRIVKAGQEQIINVPIDDHYAVIPLVEIGPPGQYPNSSHASGLSAGEYKLTVLPVREEEHIQYLAQKYESDEMSVDFEINVEGFLRMIAKIAYCTIVWKYGLSGMRERYVVPAILGTSNDIWRWVGSDGKQEIYNEMKNMKTDHIVTTWFTEEGELQARVKLFKNATTPEYHVIVGQLTPAVHGLYQSLGRK